MRLAGYYLIAAVRFRRANTGVAAAHSAEPTTEVRLQKKTYKRNINELSKVVAFSGVFAARCFLIKIF